MFTIKEPRLRARGTRARTGTMHLAHGNVQTPVFMPVGTKGSVRGLTPEMLKDLGAEIILANTYHLYLRPGETLVKEHGGLNKWINWDRPMLTDSGGFQVFSLNDEREFTQRGSEIRPCVKITENGVEFRSHLDGSTHIITPERAIEIQHALGADIIMAFDECAPAHSSKDYARTALERTHNWLVRCQRYHEKRTEIESHAAPQYLFPIVQGVVYDDLRIESAQFIASKNPPGIAIGGLSVGEGKDLMYHTLDILEPHLPDTIPRYLMGVGTPEDLVECVDRGIDMFDCVLPTRLARHGSFWTTTGQFHITNAAFRDIKIPLEPACACYTCRNFDTSYIRHLFIEKELLAFTLLSIHNLHILLDLMRRIRAAIDEDCFPEFKKTFLETYRP